MASSDLDPADTFLPYVDCKISDPVSLRTLARTIQCADKIGDELTFEATESGIILRTLNSSRSASGEFSFPSRFFDSFLVHFPSKEDPTRATTPASSKKKKAVNAKVSSRLLIPVFKSATGATSTSHVGTAGTGAFGAGAANSNWNPHGSRTDIATNLAAAASGNGVGGNAFGYAEGMGMHGQQCEQLRIQIESASNQMVFQINAKSGLRKTFRVPLIEGEILRVVHKEDPQASKILARPKFMAEILSNFHGQLDEISMTAGTKNMVLASFVEEHAPTLVHRNSSSDTNTNDDTVPSVVGAQGLNAGPGKGKIGSIMRTCMEISTKEFESYKLQRNIHEPVNLIFGFKVFCAALNFCAHTDSAMNLSFGNAGDPLFLQVIQSPSQLFFPSSSDRDRSDSSQKFTAQFVLATRTSIILNSTMGSTTVPTTTGRNSAVGGDPVESTPKVTQPHSSHNRSRQNEAGPSMAYQPKGQEGGGNEDDGYVGPDNEYVEGTPPPSDDE